MFPAFGCNGSVFMQKKMGVGGGRLNLTKFHSLSPRVSWRAHVRGLGTTSQEKAGRAGPRKRRDFRNSWSSCTFDQDGDEVPLGPGSTLLVLYLTIE